MQNPDITLTSAEIAEMESEYTALKRNQGLTFPSDRAELDWAQMLLEQVREGAVPVSGVLQQVDPGLVVDYTAPATRVATTTPAPGRAARRWWPALVIGVAVLLLGCAVISNLTGAASGAASKGKGTPGKGTPAATAITTTVVVAPPSDTPVAGAADPAVQPTLGVDFASVNGQHLTAQSPANLELAGRSFVVYPAPVDAQGNWKVKTDASYANWVPGTAVNWSFEIIIPAAEKTDDDPQGTPGPPVESGADWAKRPTVGTTITMRDFAGAIRTWTVARRDPVRRDQTDVFDQRMPGITVVIALDGTDTRWVLRSAAASPAHAPPPVLSPLPAP